MPGRKDLPLSLLLPHVAVVSFTQGSALPLDLSSGPSWPPCGPTTRQPSQACAARLGWVCARPAFSICLRSYLPTDINHPSSRPHCSPGKHGGLYLVYSFLLFFQMAQNLGRKRAVFTGCSGPWQSCDLIPFCSISDTCSANLTCTEAVPALGSSLKKQRKASSWFSGRLNQAGEAQWSHKTLTPRQCPGPPSPPHQAAMERSV